MLSLIEPKTSLGIWLVKGWLRELLQNIITVETTRYCLDHLAVDKNIICATDGHRLAKIEIKHNIPVGLYLLTQEGYLLLDKPELKFPKFEIILPDKDLEEIKFNATEYTYSFIAYFAAQKQVCLNDDLLRAIIPIFNQKDSICKVSGFVAPDKPIQVNFEFSNLKIIYLQMPIQQ